MSIKNTYNKKVKQILANGDEIEIMLGDKDYSIQCDFETCNFQCNSSKDGDIDRHTFNETFLNINNDIIITKVKELFKDQYLYNKSNLIKKINISKKYNIDEINAALDYMIENKEYMVDKLNSIGKLKNIENYYLFHPIDINESIALTNYKLRQPVPQKIEKNVILIDKDDKLLQLDTNDTFMDDLKMQILYILDFKDSIISKYNWTKISKRVIKVYHLYPNFNEKILKEFIIFHILDILKYSEKKSLLEIYLNLNKNKTGEQKDSREDRVVRLYVEKYFDKYSIEHS